MERPQHPSVYGHPSVYAFFALREVFFDGAGNFSNTGYKTTEGTPATFTFFGVIAADSNKI